MSSIAFTAAQAIYQDRLREFEDRNRRVRLRPSALRRWLDRRDAVARPAVHTSPDGVLR